jgi:hypothetical protein
MSDLRNAKKTNHLNDRVNDCLNSVNFCLIASDIFDRKPAIELAPITVFIGRERFRGKDGSRNVR